jgi:hypothetical protein
MRAEKRKEIALRKEKNRNQNKTQMLLLSSPEYGKRHL